MRSEDRLGLRVQRQSNNAAEFLVGVAFLTKAPPLLRSLVEHRSQLSLVVAFEGLLPRQDVARIRLRSKAPAAAPQSPLSTSTGQLYRRTTRPSRQD
jgi:hypothetical protein